MKRIANRGSDSLAHFQGFESVQVLQGLVALHLPFSDDLFGFSRGPPPLENFVEALSLSPELFGSR